MPRPYLRVDKVTAAPAATVASAAVAVSAAAAHAANEALVRVAKDVSATAVALGPNSTETFLSLSLICDN